MHVVEIVDQFVIVNDVKSATYDMDRVLDVSVCPKFALDVFLSKQTLSLGQVFSLCTEKSSVEGNWWEQRQRCWPETTC